MAQALGPICPHCGSVAPYGDPRLTWIRIHLDSRLHRWWWAFRKFLNDES